MKSTAYWLYGLLAVLIVAAVIILSFFIFREGFMAGALQTIRNVLNIDLLIREIFNPLD